MKQKRLYCITAILLAGMVTAVSGCGKKTESSSATDVSTKTEATDAAVQAFNTYNTAGTYNDLADGDVTVEADGVVLSGMTVPGNLIISETVGEGEVILEDMVVKGNTIIRGGGTHSIKVYRSTLGTVSIEKEGSPVRLLTENSQTQKVTVSSPAILEGSFGEVECKQNAELTSRADIQMLTLSGGASATLDSGHVQSARVEEDGTEAKLTVGTQAEVAVLELRAPAQMVVNGKVEKATIADTAAGAKLSGSGSLVSVTVAADNVILDLAAGNVDVKEGIRGFEMSGAVSQETAGASKTAVPVQVKTTAGERTASPEPPAAGTAGLTAAASPAPVQQPSKAKNESRQQETNTGNEDTQQPSSDHNSSSGNTSPDSGQKPVPVTISKVESVRNGLVRVTLSAATSTPLKLGSFSILCTGGGRDMTIQRVETADNRVYDLLTAYYNDNTYNLEVTLPDGQRINSDFTSKYDCPDIRSALLRRTEAAKAKFMYYSDSEGTFYYLLQPVSPVRQRSSVQSEPIAEQIIADGSRASMVRQGNTIEITGLSEGTAYQVYYVAAGVDGKVTPVKNTLLSSDIEENQKGDIKVSEAKGFDIPGADFGEELCGFIIKLDQPTAKPLTLDAFEISCPASGMMSIGRVASQDNQTYTVYMKPGYMYNSNNTMTVRITFPDDAGYTTFDFYVDIEAPGTGPVQFQWKDQNTVIAEFSATEEGTLYYAYLDQVESTTGRKDPSFLFAMGEGVTKTALSASNRIELKNAKAGTYFCYATEDKLGNRIAYMGYDKIPAYTPPQPDPKPEPDDKNFKIINVEYFLSEGSKYHSFKITFDRVINVTGFDLSKTTLTGVSGKVSFSRQAIEGTDSKEIVLQIMTPGITISAGTQALTLWTHMDTYSSANVVIPSAQRAVPSDQPDTDSPIPVTETETAISPVSSNQIPAESVGPGVSSNDAP